MNIFFILKNLHYLFRRSVLNKIFIKFKYIKKSAKNYDIDLISVIKKIIYSEVLNKKNEFLIKKYQKYINKKYKFSYEDWFSSNYNIWKKIFNDNNLKNKKINYLEIGSFEGRSTIFVAESLIKANLYTVDTFIGSDEHNKIDFNLVYKNFKNNTKYFSKRLTINRMSSKKFFKINKNKFDLIYIDGSHFCNDVKNDFSNSIKIANKDCIIILDDLLWDFYKNKKNNPINGILPILSKNKDILKIIHINNQLILQKV
jgi:predicted O-methyltransferase YrrM